MIYDYRELVRKAIDQEEKVAFVTLARPDGYYDERLKNTHCGKIETIGWKKRRRVN